MDELMDMMVADESPSGISDRIKEILFTKSAGKVDNVKATVASAMFGEIEDEGEVESEVDSTEISAEDPQEED